MDNETTIPAEGERCTEWELACIKLIATILVEDKQVGPDLSESTWQNDDIPTLTVKLQGKSGGAAEIKVEVVATVVSNTLEEGD